MSRRIFVLTVSALVLALAAPVAAPVAAAAPAAVSIDSSAPRLAAKDDGGWTVALGLTNLTDGAMTLTAEPLAAIIDCTVRLDPDRLPRAEHTYVTATVPASCDVPDTGIRFALAATTAGAGDAAAPSGSFEIVAAPKPDDPRPEWHHLLVFLLAPVIWFVLLVSFRSEWAPRGTDKVTKLPGFKGSWSFRTSWASNVTVIGTLVTAFLSTSGVARILFGDDADAAVALATVGSAIAVGLATAGAMVVLASRGDDDAPTVLGLLSAAALTLGAAAGELWIGFHVGLKVDIGDSDGWFTGMLLAGWALLAWYAYRSLRYALLVGSTEPPPPPPTPPPGDAIAHALAAILPPEAVRPVRAPLL